MSSHWEQPGKHGTVGGGSGGSTAAHRLTVFPEAGHLGGLFLRPPRRGCVLGVLMGSWGLKLVEKC